MKQLFQIIILAGLMAASQTQPAAAQTVPDFATDISGRVIAAISDGDFIGQSYVDGKLAPLSTGSSDILSVLTLGPDGVITRSLPVSNSVTAAPEVLDVSPDGDTAFVVERLGDRTGGTETVRDLPPGNRLFAIDLRSDKALKLSDTATVMAFPEALAVSPDGGRVAVVSNTPEASFLSVIGFREGRFETPLTLDLKALGVTGSAAAPRGGVTATNVQWHPSGRFLAVNVNTQNRVAFFRVDADGSLSPWGEPVTVGPDPFVGRFTPDGGYYLTSDWGRDFKATSLDGRLPVNPSAISVIRLADRKAGGAVNHERIGGAETDLSSEGIAVSPDGRLVATINMRETAFPKDSPRFDREGTVTLLSFDPSTGSIRKIADYPFEGVLPEGGTFDATGDHFLATVFEGHDGAAGQTGPGLEVFRVVKTGQPRLERRGRIELPHGVHHVDIGG